MYYYGIPVARLFACINTLSHIYPTKLRMDAQFSDLHQNPDIVIATPGRLLHIAVEMGLKLSTVEYVVFDEADRYVITKCNWLH